MGRRALLFAVLTALGCGPTRLQKTLPPNVRVDTYKQQAASAIDVLWIVDNSGSMAPYQANLARSFQSFIQLFTRGSIDYRLAVTTTDIFNGQGSLVGSPPVIAPTDGDPAAEFETNVQVGTGGSPYSPALEAAVLALNKQTNQNAPVIAELQSCQQACGQDQTCQQNCAGQFQVPFLRPNAYLYMVFVQDKDDPSPEDLRYFYRTFEDVKGIGNDGTVNVSAITGIVPTPPCGAQFGPRYIEMAKLTNGVYGDICDADFSTTLKALAENAVGLRRTFALGEKPNVETISVSIKYPCNIPADVTASCAAVDDSACSGEAVDFPGLVCTPQQGGPDGWAYEADNNVIFFAGDSVPYLNAEIDIQYYQQGTGP